MRFSGRNKDAKSLEIEPLTTELKNDLWRIIKQYLNSVQVKCEFEGKRDRYFFVMERFFQQIWEKYFTKDLFQLKPLKKKTYFDTNTAEKLFEGHFLSSEWFTIFDLYEETNSHNKRFIRVEFSFEKYFNQLAEEVNLHYYFQKNKIEKKD